jgi:hypothetical protein
MPCRRTSSSALRPGHERRADIRRWPSAPAPAVQHLATLPAGISAQAGVGRPPATSGQRHYAAFGLPLLQQVRVAAGPPS